MASTSVIHYLDFVCDGYSGNFERELTSYVFNLEDWENEDRDYSRFLSDEESGKFSDILHEEFLAGFYNEYGLTTSEVGHYTDPVDGKNYHTVRVQVHESNWKKVTPELIELLKERARKFFHLYLEKLPSYQLKEGAFLKLVHSYDTIVQTREVL